MVDYHELFSDSGEDCLDQPCSYDPTVFNLYLYGVVNVGALWSKATAYWDRVVILGSLWTVQLSLESLWARVVVELSQPFAITPFGVLLGAHQLEHFLEHT
ncbi:hypothetical protein U1Q18_035332 [Sarracenia purpurea var. burkii]